MKNGMEQYNPYNPKGGRPRIRPPKPMRGKQSLYTVLMSNKTKANVITSRARSVEEIKSVAERAANKGRKHPDKATSYNERCRLKLAWIKPVRIISEQDL